MARHVEELKIRAFRGLKNIYFQGFNHVNIFTGNNNIGKTSLLEVLCMVGDPLKLSSWFNIAYAARFAGKSTYTELQRLFPIDGEGEISFTYKVRDKEHSVSARSMVTQTKVPKDELMRLNGYMATGAQRIENKEMLDMALLSVEINYDGIKSSTDVYEEQNRIVGNYPEIEDSINCFYISQNEKVGGYYDILGNVLRDNHYRNLMIEVLQQFDSNIESISMLGTELFIYARNHRQAVPLGVYGTGMKRAVYILAAIIQNKNGCLMIDEFETGIHEEAIEKMFKLIYETALEQNVQIFMTTHNSSAVKRLLDLGEDYIAKTNLYTLYDIDYRNVVRRLSGVEIAQAIDLGVVIR